MGGNVIGTGLWGNTLFGQSTGGNTQAGPLTVRVGIIYVALRIAGILNNAQRTPAPEEEFDCFNALNTMLDGWAVERLLVFNINRSIQTLTPGKQDYLIGTGAPDWNVPRPVRIEHASLIYTGDSNATQPVELPMAILTYEDWQRETLKAVASTVPYKLYYETGFPFGTAHFWPYPSIVEQVALYLWQSISQFNTIQDPVNLPPQYLEAVQYNLALTINDRFPRAVMKPSAIAKAQLLKSKIKNLNAPLVDVACDPALVRKYRGYWDWRTGGL